MIRILIADDHQLLRDGLASMLNKHEDISVLATVGDGIELFDYLENNEHPSIILLDIAMPEMDGFEVLTKIKKKHPVIKCIAISMHDEGQYIQKCVRLGAFSYLLKNTDENELIHAIEQVSLGKKYFSDAITQKMIHNMTLEGDDIKKLSRREGEILKLVAEGKTTKEIAELLFISTRTVETHRTNMMKKLDVNNTAELISKAIQLDLL